LNFPGKTKKQKKEKQEKSGDSLMSESPVQIIR
jgi:hypothetical protein